MKQGGEIQMLYNRKSQNPPLESYTAITICSLQSMQAIFTFFVARTELPQQGQRYFRVELGLVAVGGAGACVPVPVTL